MKWKKVLDRTQPSDFIARCNALLSQRESSIIPDLERPLASMVYVSPPYVTGVDDIEFRDLLHDHVLGHLDVAHRSAENELHDKNTDTKHRLSAAQLTKDSAFKDDIFEQEPLSPRTKQEKADNKIHS